MGQTGGLRHRGFWMLLTSLASFGFNLMCLFIFKMPLQYSVPFATIAGLALLVGMRDTNQMLKSASVIFMPPKPKAE
jgi:hypothetical protein